MNDPVNFVDHLGNYRIKITKNNVRDAAVFAGGMAVAGMCAGGPKTAAFVGASAFVSTLAIDVVINHDLGMGGDDSARIIDIDVPLPWDDKKP